MVQGTDSGWHKSTGKLEGKATGFAVGNHVKDVGKWQITDSMCFDDKYMR